MRSMLAIALLGCGPDVQLLVEPLGPLEVDTWLEHVNDAGGVLVVQTVFDPGGEVRLPEPPSEGELAYVPVNEPVSERVGGREVLTQRYRFTGKGSQEIPALEATWSAPGQDAVTDASSPLFVDLGVAPPRDGELADIVEPDLVWVPPWGAIAAVAGVGGLMATGIWLALRGLPARVEQRARPEAPDLRALRRWDAVRTDSTLDAEGKATALSLIFREYTEDVLAFPAASWTTTEILRHLEALQHLPQGNLPRARRLLRATDRVKYADARATAELFEELDADLRAFVGSTRPQRLDAPREVGR